MTMRVAVLLALGLATGARAQQAPAPVGPSATLPPYRVIGKVSDPTGNAVLGADVSLMEGESAVRGVRTDSSGRFQLLDMTAAKISLRVRRLGFEGQTVEVQVTKAGRTANVDVVLQPNHAHLDTVVVNDAPPSDRPNPRLVAFNDRAATNSFGHYLTEAMLAKLRPQHASEALRTVSGIIIRPAASRVGNIVRLRGCGIRGSSAERVGPLVWVDGVRLPGAEIDDVTAGMDIAGIEVYNSFAGVPAQYLDRTAVCGTILVWTKHR
jgi:hypothetical protein